MSLLVQHGYLGAFLSAFISHLIPFVAFPYLAVVWLLASTIPGLDPLLVGVLSGVGAGLGKLSSYFIGRGGARAVGEECRRQLEVLRGLVRDYAAVAVFIASATPVPDDVVLISVGMINYPVWKYLLATLSGKVFLCTVVALSASGFAEAVGWLAGGGGGWLSVAASIAFMLAATYVILRVDWAFVAEEVARSGWSGLAKRVRREGPGVLFSSKHRPP